MWPHPISDTPALFRQLVHRTDRITAQINQRHATKWMGHCRLCIDQCVAHGDVHVHKSKREIEANERLTRLTAL